MSASDQALAMSGTSSGGLPRVPYPGLRPFAPEEWRIFFGREIMVDEVIRRLVQHRLLVVHGDSGAGKSSLIYAGVLPVLAQRAQRNTYRWRTCHATPGDQPIESLADALCSLSPEPDSPHMRFNLRRAFSFGRECAAELARLVRADSQEPICLLLDQFEELFAQPPRGGAQEVRQVIEFLIGVFQGRAAGIHVIVTMRSEFLGSCAQYKDFAETVNATQYLLPRLKRVDLLRAIREPARLYDGYVDRALAETLIDETTDTPDQLPLIQHGLMMLHLWRNDAETQKLAETPESVSADEDLSTPPAWRLTLGKYRYRRRSLGQMLSDHADDVAAAAEKAAFPERKEPRIVERIFRAITKVNADGNAVRYRQTLAQLAIITTEKESDLRAVLQPFREEGVSLLRPYGNRPLRSDDTVDISHEALIRSWDKISDPVKGWLELELRDGLAWRALIEQVRDFEKSRKNVLTPGVAEDRKALILRHSREWSQRYGGQWDAVNKLVSTSITTGKEAAQLRMALWIAPIVILATAAVLFTNNLRQQDALRQANAVLTAERDAEAARRDADRLAREKAVVDNTNEERLTEIRSAADALLEQQQLPDNVRQQVEAIKSSTAASNVEIQAATRNIAPRVYMFISEESQRPAAQAIADKLPGLLSIGSRAVIVPRVSLRRSRSSVLRCFSTDDCSEMSTLFPDVKRLITSPDVQLQDQSPQVRAGTLPATRPRHYELWFAPGPIVAAP
jgi:hypothetical protein